MKRLFSLLSVVGLLVFFSSSAIAQKKNEVPENAIPAQTDPLVIELEHFETHQLTGERSYITIINNTVRGQVTNQNALSSKLNKFNSRYALKFDNCEATISEPRYNKKGTKYTFEVKVKDAEFYNATVSTDWRLTITIDSNNGASVMIESSSIAQTYGSPSWMFTGRVNKDNTDALKQIKDTMPAPMPAE